MTSPLKTLLLTLAASMTILMAAADNPHPDPTLQFIRESSLFGNKVLIFHPEDKAEDVSAAVAEVFNRLHGQEFSADRYALLFTPGDYTSAGTFNIPFYTHIAGLGRTPYEVKLSNITTPPHLQRDNGTCTFWRSAENFSIIGPESWEEEEMFRWAVSQAAPLRRVYSQRVVKHQWNSGWVSGGFTADCCFDAAAGSNSQQQWYTRNSHLTQGRGQFAESCFNYCFEGVTLGSMADKESYYGPTQRENVTFLPTTSRMREKPFLLIGDDGRFKVFKPSLRRDSRGTSYSRLDMGPGEVFDLKDDFFIVKDKADVTAINEAIAEGKNILFTPGMYTLSTPILISRSGTIVMGLGWATLIPAADNPHTAIETADVDDVTVCSLLFDAHNSSESLLHARSEGRNHSERPTLLADLYFRIGGFKADKVHVNQAVVIDSNDLIGDHFWIWRADHGLKGSVGWEVNTANNGLVVGGDRVSIHGLFNEHFQQYQTLWQGEDGEMVFYQCETPYDAPTQEAYMSEQGSKPGYAAYKVADNVQRHSASALSIYDVLINDIRIDNALETPDETFIHNLCSTSFSKPGKRGFNRLLNGRMESTFFTPRGRVIRFKQ